jgi:glycerol-3-phosphate dehydrogenase subunit C
MIPNTEVNVIERCSGHGGTWGIKKANHETAIKVGKPVFRKALEHHNTFVSSTCPLSCDHIKTGIDAIQSDSSPARTWHPIEIFAKAYGL